MTLTPKMITLEEARERFDIDQYDPLNGTYPYADAVILLEGDVEIDGDFTKNFLKESILGGTRTTSRELIIIDGNLFVTGELGIGEDAEPNPSLLVLGDLHCGTVTSGDDFVHITGDARIEHALNGHFSLGAIAIDGITHVPYLLYYNHQCKLTPADSVIIINYYDDTDAFFECNYYSSDLIDVCLPELFELTEEEVANLDEDEREDVEFCRMTFLNLVEKGISPFRKDAKPPRQRRSMMSS